MERRWRRSLLLVAGSAVALGTPAILAWPGFAATAPRTMSVSSPAALASALATARPGDRILVADGSYGTPLTLTRSGTATAPITIAARNTFASNRSGNLVTVSADNSEVDHNAFLNKSTAGVYLQISGPGSSGMAKNVHIHHNWFFNHHFGGANGGESLRLGLSGRQHADAHALVELNLFEKANGDSEAISVKSSDNIVRYNTILNSRGTLSLRHGWGTLVEGNLLIGGTTGIRFFGNNHVVINNVVQGTTGQALEIGGGEIRDDTRSTRAHEAADHCLVAFNTFQSSRAGAARYGSDKKFDPSDITLADNIFVDRGGALLTGTGTQLRDEGNVLFGGTPGSFPKGTFRMVDPRLVPGDGGLLRLSSGSPAIDAGVGGYPMVSLDLDGQSRTGPKDVGADEFRAAGPQHRPLTSADVGPKAP